VNIYLYVKTSWETNTREYVEREEEESLFKVISDE